MDIQKTILFNFNNFNYQFTLPRWWNNIKIDLSDIEFSNSYTIGEYCEEHFGADNGTKKTWRKALKAHALYDLQNNKIPIYIAHCASAGEEHDYAVKIYTELYHLVRFLNNDDLDDQSKDWLWTYLAFSAGEKYEALKQNELAIIWYQKSIQFIESKDSSARYYAEQSKENLGRLLKNKLKNNSLNIQFKFGKTPKVSAPEIELFRNFCVNEFNSKPIYSSSPVFEENQIPQVLNWIQENCSKELFGLFENILAVTIADKEPYPLSEVIHSKVKSYDLKWYEENVISNRDKLISIYEDMYFSESV
jgi:tetratricopeptide (TPR) repeat protein